MPTKLNVMNKINLRTKRANLIALTHFISAKGSDLTFLNNFYINPIIFIFHQPPHSVPHIFFIASTAYDNYIQITSCPVPYDSFWKNYLAHHRPHLVANIPDTPFLLPVYEVRCKWGKQRGEEIYLGGYLQF